MGSIAESPLQCRPLVETDLNACFGLDRLARDGGWSEAAWRRELVEPQRPCLGFWQEETLLALACGWLILEELHVTLVAVHPGRRRTGLGRRALEALLEQARLAGAERATLEVAAGNTAALGLYAALGFHTAGRRRGYYRDGQDALIQWVKLGPVCA